MTRLPARLCLPFLLLLPAQAQVAYTLRFEPGGEQWEVEAHLPAGEAQRVSFHIPAWTPGAYHPAEFGRFVTELSASDDRGSPLTVERLGPGDFELDATAAEGGIVVRYRADSISTGVFTNDTIDVEANRIAQDYAYVNPASLFGFVPELEGEPVTLQLSLPAGWDVATVLESDPEGLLHAPSYLRFEDSPLLFSPRLESADFEVDGKPHRISVHGRSAEEVATIAAGCKRIVEAASRLMGGLPYDRYQFLYGFVDGSSGSGLEHSFSTLILVGPHTALDDSEESFWGITAHEFFHLWCAERIHVEGIHRPDLTAPIETGTIWVNEGITEYFCRQILLHAGFIEREQLLESYVRTQIPAGALPKEAWTDVSRATAAWAGMQDLMMFAARMYVLGPPTIFALDMTMRRETGGERGVYDLLHHLMDEYVAKDRGFGEDELSAILGKVSGPEAQAFYARFIDGDEIPDAASYLDVIGYALEDGALVELEEPTAAQERARADYFSATGSP